MPGSRSSFVDLGGFGGVMSGGGFGGGGVGGDAQGRNLRWMDDFGDELAVAIAVRDWDESVALVEKGELSFDASSLSLR